MKAIIDTSSLLSLVRYYLPFDKNNKMFNFIKSEFENQNLILIDEVYEECKHTSKGIVLNTLDYLKLKEFQKEYKIPFKTKDLIPPSPKKFYNQLDNNFNIPLSRKKISEAEFEKEKKKYLESADARMIILGLIKKSENKEIAIITEETETGNDSKVFKKIPAICRELNIKVMTLPELIETYKGIYIEFK